jgi:Fe-S cluster biogenesis protein NfuA
MHGGSHAISHLDAEVGEVTLELGGARSGGGISPMTIQALKLRLTQEIPEIRVVHADTAETESTLRGFDRDAVPF